MKKRILSGAVYTALLVGVFLIKIFLGQPWGNFAFDVLLYFFSVVGTWEMLRAMDDALTEAEKNTVTAFSIVCVPACSVFETLYGFGVYAAAVLLLLLSVALLSLLIFKNAETRLESLGTAFLCAVYPTLLLCVLVLTNHFGEVPMLPSVPPETSGAVLSDSVLAMLFVFIVSPLSDVAAFFTGISLKNKFPKKLAPNISPNKTVVGFIGGLLGGAISGVGIYFVYNAICGSFANMYIKLPVYLAVGLLASLATVFGDLIESAIKRQRGIKDMGNIMPGHGGVLDRIDGTLFAAIAVYAAFLVAKLFVI